jgi:hypothetical protein
MRTLEAVPPEGVLDGLGLLARGMFLMPSWSCLASTR